MNGAHDKHFIAIISFNLLNSTIVGVIIFSILQVRKVNFREAKSLI